MDENTESIINFLAGVIYHLEEAGDNLEGIFIPSNDIVMHPVYELTFKEHLAKIRNIQYRIKDLKDRIAREASQ